MQKTKPVKYHEAWQKLCAADGVLVPGGFGTRGTEGKIMACKWARENKIPFLGEFPHFRKFFCSSAQPQTYIHTCVFEQFWISSMMLQCV